MEKALYILFMFLKILMPNGTEKWSLKSMVVARHELIRWFYGALII
jgi:hypothetical protein